MPAAQEKLAFFLVRTLVIATFVSIAIASPRAHSGRIPKPNDQLRTSRLLQADSNGAASLSPAGPNVPRMEQVIQSFVSDQHFMGSVLVARGGEIILDEGYGFANLEWNIPNSPATKFRLG
jgi:CubicO group peptidase (beta-lactamase class C family)